MQCHHFDEEMISEQAFVDAIIEPDEEGAENDILVANFGVDIAQGHPEKDGGHLALIAKCNPCTGLSTWWMFIPTSTASSG